jgi:hypothetical protein
MQARFEWSGRRAGTSRNGKVFSNDTKDALKMRCKKGIMRKRWTASCYAECTDCYACGAKGMETFLEGGVKVPAVAKEVGWKVKRREVSACKFGIIEQEQVLFDQQKRSKRKSPDQ